MDNMKSIILLLIFFGMYLNLYPQSLDQNYSAEYVLKDAGGNMLSRLNMYRSGSKIKFVKVDNSGKSNETTTDIYIFKDEPKIYNIVTNSAGKFGTKNEVDIMYVGMQTGVYILDLGHDSKIFNANSRAGTETVLGKDCIKYTIASNGEASSDYYMYQDNLMLKRWVGGAAEGNTIEAINFDNTTVVPESIFVLPTDVRYLN